MKPLDIETRAMFSETLVRLLPPAQGPRGDDQGTSWTTLAESGVLSLGLPEWCGGFDAGLTDQGLVTRALGASLSPEPYLSGVIIAGWLLARLQGATAASDVTRIPEGRLRLSLAHFEARGGFDPDAVEGQVTDQGGRPVITATKTLVQDIMTADAFLVSARDRTGMLKVYRVERNAAGSTIAVRKAVDGSDIGTLALKQTPGTPIGNCDATGALWAALDRGAVGACGQALGAMEEIARHTREYLKTRRAFGKTLSQFQVLQHRFVDILIALEETRAVVAAAEAACDREDSETELAVATCKVVTSRAARFVGNEGIHLHGGIGVTDSLVISHFYKRLMVLDTYFGHGEYHLRAHARRTQARYRNVSDEASARLRA